MIAVLPGSSTSGSSSSYSPVGARRTDSKAAAVSRSPMRYGAEVMSIAG